MKNMKLIATFLRTLAKERKGTVTVEVAMTMTVFSVLLLGMVDFGLAYSRQMEMSNAVRAGAQYALVRPPSLASNADSISGITSLNDVRNAALNAAHFLDADPGVTALTASALCYCPDGSAVACAAASGGGLPCADRETYIEVDMTLPYELLFVYPGVGNSLTLNASNTIRLN